MDMNIVCLDLEGVLVPEIWIAFAEASGIPELKRTTRGHYYQRYFFTVCRSVDEKAGLPHDLLQLSGGSR